eukprot:gene24380-31738_t
MLKASFLFYNSIVVTFLLLLSNASLFEDRSNLHQVVPALPWNDTYPYHLLRAGLPSHEFRLHPGIITESNKLSEPFYLAFTDFRNHSFGNHLGIYFEILSCAIETDTPIEILFPFHFEPLRSDSEANIEMFLGFLPLSLSRGDNSTAEGNSDTVLAVAREKMNSVCVCGEYCWANPSALWVRHLNLIRTIMRTALDRSMRSLEKLGMLRALDSNNSNSNLTYEFFAGTWQPLVPDVSIHFRCSDVLGSTNGAYGYLNFNAYEKLIPADTRLLYILSDHPDRSKERGQSALCGQLVEHLAVHLRAVLPLALVVPLRGGTTLSIHDIPAMFGDLVLSLAQLTLSGTTICSSSTFCLWPALASEGTAYFPHSALLLGRKKASEVRQLAPPNFKLIMSPQIMSFAGFTTDLSRILALLTRPLKNVEII